MTIQLINPHNMQRLELVDGNLVDSEGSIFPIVRGVVRITGTGNYADSFSLQWKRFNKIQLDHDANGYNLSHRRFFSETRWEDRDLAGKDVLEVGSGAGRFSRVVLECTGANLFSVDYSDAVTVNFENNGKIAPERFQIFQASIYEMPFPDDSFDKVFCFGVLQHTPNFDASIKALIDKTKPGGEVVVDFYPVNGWWSKIHAKYILRPFTTRMSHEFLMRAIESNINWLLRLERFLRQFGFGRLTRFLPLVDIQSCVPRYLSDTEQKEWAVLDTFDMFSPRYDNPQRIDDVVAMFERYGAEVTFAGFEHFDGFSAAVVRGVKCL